MILLIRIVIIVIITIVIIVAIVIVIIVIIVVIGTTAVRPCSLCMGNLIGWLRLGWFKIPLITL